MGNSTVHGRVHVDGSSTVRNASAEFQLMGYWKSYQTSHARFGGNWPINGQTTGRGLADFLVGAVSAWNTVYRIS